MSRKTFFVMLLLSQFLPLPVFGSDVVRVQAPAAKPYELDDLTLSELENTFGDFKVIHKGGEIENKFDTEAYLSGTVFQKCWNKFEITNSLNDDELKANKRIGFRVRDLGGGRDCQKALRTQVPRAKCIKDDPELNCVRLSQVEEAKMNLATLGDGPIEILQLKDGDLTRVDGQPIPDLPAHVSKKTALDARKAKQEAARKKEIQDLQHCVDTCRGDQARESLSKLLDLGFEIDIEAATRKIELRELADIQKELEKAKPEDLQEIRERLLTFNDEHPGHADAVAASYRKAALAMVNKKGVKAADYEVAMSMVSEASELSGLGKQSKDRFDKDQLDLQVGRMQAIALDGMQGNMLFMPNYYNLMQQLQMNAMKACNGNGASLEGCSTAMQTLRSASAIPQTAQAIDQSRYQMQQQVQQQMQMAMNPQLGMNPQMGMGAGMNFSAMPNSTPANPLAAATFGNTFQTQTSVNPLAASTFGPQLSMTQGFPR